MHAKPRGHPQVQSIRDLAHSRCRPPDGNVHIVGKGEHRLGGDGNLGGAFVRRCNVSTAMLGSGISIARVHR